MREPTILQNPGTMARVDDGDDATIGHLVRDRGGWAPEGAGDVTFEGIAADQWKNLRVPEEEVLGADLDRKKMSEVHRV